MAKNAETDEAAVPAERTDVQPPPPESKTAETDEAAIPASAELLALLEEPSSPARDSAIIQYVDRHWGLAARSFLRSQAIRRGRGDSWRDDWQVVLSEIPGTLEREGWRTAPRATLFRIAKNVSSRRIRKVQAGESHRLDTGEPHGGSPGFAPGSTELISRIQIKSLLDELHKTDPELGVAVSLRFEQGMTWEEVALALDTGAEAVRKRVERQLKRWVEKLR